MEFRILEQGSKSNSRCPSQSTTESLMQKDGPTLKPAEDLIIVAIVLSNLSTFLGWDG